MPTASHRPDYFYSGFVERLSLSVKGSITATEVEHLLNGAAADEAHSRIPRAIRSGDGIFFSGHALSNEAAKLASASIEAGAKIFDPACGAGDLLLAAARLLPLESSLNKTVEIWGQRIGGSDLHQSFVDATKWRLALLAKQRHCAADELSDFALEQLFPLIVKHDYLLDPSVSKGFECLITNPPFGHRKAAKECDWSSGRTQLAAIFMEKVIQSRAPGHTTIAILPDVLRGGSRYGRWRDWIDQHTIVTATQIYGRFEKRTDVDVFICKLQQREARGIQSPSQKADTSNTQTVKDLFNVRVGPVVPHRHAEQGELRPYLTVANAPANTETTVSQQRRFTGAVITPPFVAIRRTSNPADAQRVVCTIILGDEEVAVENHLIIAAPHSKSLADCRKLVEVLSSKQTRDYVDNVLRCRHLTIGSINSIPVHNWKEV